jgi:rod shape-determining protein MreD
MRNTAFLSLGIALLLVQSVCYWVIQLIPISGITPSFLLPLIVFMGVHEYSLARGAAIACVLGYGLDLFAAAPVGLFTFVSVATFVLARAAGVRLAAHHIITQMPLALAFSVIQSVMVFVLLAIFRKSAFGALEILTLAAPQAASTALFSPIVFALASKVLQVTSTAVRGSRGPAS